MIRTIVKDNGVLITSYSTLVIHQEIIISYNWHYIILDEGHKIRKPDAQATLACKQVSQIGECLEPLSYFSVISW